MTTLPVNNQLNLTVEIPGLLELVELLKSGRVAPVNEPATVPMMPAAAPFAPVIPNATPDMLIPSEPIPNAIPAATSMMPSQTAPVVPPIIPASVPTYTLDDLMRASCSVADAGKRQDVLNLYGQFGIAALTALPKERYGEYAAALIGLGAKL